MTSASSLPTFLQHRLANGLIIVGEHNPLAQSFAAGFFVRTGSRDEMPDVAGVSHFLEHMMFKGTAARSAEDVNREFDEMGANYNAFTSEECTVYYGAVLPEFQRRLLGLWCDLLRPALRQEDFDLEKNVILEEIALYKDDPQATLIDLARSKHHGGHALGNSVLGTTESVSALRREQMLGYFERRYAPNNVTLVLTGNFDWEAAVAQAENICGEWLPQPCPRDLSDPTPARVQHIEYSEKFARAHLCIVAPAPPAQSPARHAGALISDMVGDSHGSRLYWALVHPGIADTAQLFYSEEDGSGAYYLYASCDPARAGEVLTKIRGILSDVTDQGVSADELQRAQRKVGSGLALAAETPLGRMRFLGFDWLYRLELRTVDETVDALTSVTVDECRHLLAADPFAAATVVALGPVRSLDGDADTVR